MTTMCDRHSYSSKATIAFLSIFLAVQSGCSTNQNEAEFLKSAPPGKPPENPNEGVAERRSRTLRPSKPDTGKGAKDATTEKK
jgi:hypothetical protein